MGTYAIKHTCTAQQQRETLHLAGGDYLSAMKDSLGLLTCFCSSLSSNVSTWLCPEHLSAFTANRHQQFPQIFSYWVDPRAPLLHECTQSQSWLNMVKITKRKRQYNIQHPKGDAVGIQTMSQKYTTSRGSHKLFSMGNHAPNSSWKQFSFICPNLAAHCQHCTGTTWCQPTQRCSSAHGPAGFA